MDDIKIRRGETLEMTVTADDDTADTLNLIVAASDGTVIINETENFSTVDGDRVAVIRTDDTDHEEAEYEYMLTITYSDGVVDKMPDPANCEDEDCDLPTLTICKTLDSGVS
jgi:hypothetical protein